MAGQQRAERVKVAFLNLPRRFRLLCLLLVSKPGLEGCDLVVKLVTLLLRPCFSHFIQLSLPSRNLVD